ncbi:hypothetical protein ATE48_03115 [Candidatus Viadribacter manganicus]|uniref:Uncharacterized protein n=2 Tax=Candidatus Viadribacter manganicus TaxID=1759059 RepID=A0A1B1AEJ5_9PROT|nr:hypothetical protein ATE48_03115 [Candidatus Viadribacter manganicus]
MFLIALTVPLLVVGAAMALLTLASPRISAGCFLSFISLAIALLTLFGVMMMECFPIGGVTCPTDNERRVVLLSIGVETLVANAAMWIAVASKGARSDERGRC